MIRRVAMGMVILAVLVLAVFAATAVASHKVPYRPPSAASTDRAYCKLLVISDGDPTETAIIETQWSHRPHGTGSPAFGQDLMAVLGQGAWAYATDVRKLTADCQALGVSQRIWPGTVH